MTTYPASLSNVPNPPSGASTLGGSTPSHTVHTQALVDAVNETQAAVQSVARADQLVFDAVDYGAVVDGVTDDTPAWQAAINACATAGGGVVTSSKAGVSVIAGALQDTSGANAQLTLPSIDAVDSEQISVTIRGPWAPPTVMSVIGTTPVPDNHLVLKSTLAAGTGAILGAIGPAGTFNNFTNVDLHVERVGFRTVSNPTVTALDLRNVCSVELDRVVVDCGSYYIQGLTQPTTATSYGIRLPKNGNGAHVRLGQVDVVGFYTGIEVSEHAMGEMVAVWGCKVAAEFDAADHASTFTRLMAVHCPTGLKFTGAHAVDVWQFDVEHAASGWWVTVNDVDDASSLGKGFLRWWVVLAGVGADSTFTKSGGSNLTTSRVGDVIGAGGGGSTVYAYRDRLVAVAGNDTLTLGASPVANSPLVWVNNVIKWPGTDYTISGSVATFSTPLSASDVVLVKYESTSSSASASSLSTAAVVINIADNFDRSNSTSSLGATSTGSKTWTQHAGTWGISSNKAYVSAGVAAQTCKATVDAGAGGNDVTVGATLSVASGTPTCGLVVRSDGAGNEYVVEVTIGAAGTPKIYKGTAGSYTAIATGASTTVAAGSVITAALVGNTITVKDDGVTIVSVTDSTWSTHTRHGLYAVAPASTTSPARHDDFSITN